jgi:senataxin
MAGDPHQLPALVSDEGIKLNHNISMMERLLSLGYKSILLSTQRRMHPNIVEFSNKTYYEGKLKTDYKPLKGNNENPFEIININSKEERIYTSYINKIEADKCIELYKYFKNKNLFDKIIIITPYSQQCKLLKELDKNIEIHTVDSFQGHEADVVILSTVRTENIGFWADYRRLNVAMTRAKHVLRIVGNKKCWTEGPLNDLINFYK